MSEIIVNKTESVIDSVDWRMEISITETFFGIFVVCAAIEQYRHLQSINRFCRNSLLQLRGCRLKFTPYDIVSFSPGDMARIVFTIMVPG